VENLDANVGRLLRHLEARGLDRSTVVVFLSDNGGLSTLERRGNPATSNAPLRAGKGWLYEGGLRIPLLVRGPGIAAGSTRSDRIGTTDLMPTLLELAGLSPGPRLDGRSVVSALTGKALPAREQFWHFPHYHGSGSRPASAVRRGSLKLIQSLEDGRLQLFDLAKDPGETTDIAARRPREAARLLRILEAWRDRVKAQMPTR
jgi:arylsulfatase A-like enzyme